MPTETQRALIVAAGVLGGVACAYFGAKLSNKMSKVRRDKAALKAANHTAGK